MLPHLQPLSQADLESRDSLYAGLPKTRLPAAQDLQRNAWPISASRRSAGIRRPFFLDGQGYTPQFACRRGRSQRPRQQRCGQYSFGGTANVARVASEVSRGFWGPGATKRRDTNLGHNPRSRGGDDAQYDVGASHNARSSGNVAFYRDALRMLPHFGDIVCELHPQKMIHVGAERLRKLPKSLVTKSPELHLGLSFVSMYGCTVRVSNSLNESETLLCAFRGSSPLIAPREDWPSRPSRHSPSPGYATHLPLVTSQSPLAPCSNYQTRNNLTTTPHGATLQLGRAICRQVSQRLTKSGGCPHVASPNPSPHVTFPRRQSRRRSKVVGLLDSGIAQTTGKHEALKATQTHLA